MSKRRRKVGNPRGPKPSGNWDKNRNRISTPRIEPTEESSARRREIIGTGMNPDDPRNNLALAENPLNALYARGILTEQQRDAGERYAKLHAMRFRGVGPKHATGLNWGALVAPSLDGEAFSQHGEDLTDLEKRQREEDIRVAYDFADMIVRRCGSRSHREVQNVCAYGRWPLINFPTSLARTRATNRSLECLRDGLEALARHWNIPAREEKTGGAQKAA